MKIIMKKSIEKMNYSLIHQAKIQIYSDNENESQKENNSKKEIKQGS